MSKHDNGFNKLIKCESTVTMNGRSHYTFFPMTYIHMNMTGNASSKVLSILLHLSWAHTLTGGQND